MSGRSDIFEPQKIRRRLQALGDRPQVAFERVPGVSMEGLTPAAVLIALTEIEGQMHAVFTKRPDTMPEHSGEVSFPGGRVEDEDESLEQTALRESQEEIALHPEAVELFGALVRMPTVTGYVVTTFVGEFKQPYELQPSPREIETLFTAPLVELAEPTRHRLESRSWNGHTFELHFYEYDGQVIWGATGYMLHTLLGFLGGEES
jgi:8-oxo-dGTP pyrophosphatase MutT (NUDIX family)